LGGHGKVEIRVILEETRKKNDGCPDTRMYASTSLAAMRAIQNPRKIRYLKEKISDTAAAVSRERSHNGHTNGKMSYGPSHFLRTLYPAFFLCHC
jgi:hypothetical protein